MKIDFDNNGAKIFRECIKLKCTAMGHYCLSLTKLPLCNCEDQAYLIVLHIMDIKNEKTEEDSKVTFLNVGLYHRPIKSMK